MTRYKLIWLQIADQQYHDLIDPLRDLVNHRIAQLLENPTIDPDAVYNERSDQWSVPLEDRGFLFYAVVRDPATVIILRLVSFFCGPRAADAASTRRRAGTAQPGQRLPAG